MKKRRARRKHPIWLSKKVVSNILSKRAVSRVLRGKTDMFMKIPYPAPRKDLVTVSVEELCPFLDEKSVVEKEWEKTKEQRKMKNIIYGGVREFENNDKIISEMCKDRETAIRLIECIEDKGE